MKPIRLFIRITLLSACITALLMISMGSQPRHKPGPQQSSQIPRSRLAQLRAVLVVGPTEEATRSSIEKIQEVALYLKDLGVTVKEFYDPDAHWADICRDAKGAHIFLYSGHGTLHGNNKEAGGLCLSGREIVSSTQIRSELLLHKNALVLFHTVCYSAGSSAVDKSDIGIAVAARRVSEYAHPFLSLGAAGYYANNYTNSMVQFLSAFFQQKPIKQIYTTEASRYCRIDTLMKCPYDPAYEISVASTLRPISSTRTSVKDGVTTVEKIPAFKEYNVAFAGFPGYTVMDLFKKE